MYGEAREHKRLQGLHRRRASERMEALNAFCARHGITVEIARAEAQRHGPRTDTTTTHHEAQHA